MWTRFETAWVTGMVDPRRPQAPARPVPPKRRAPAQNTNAATAAQRSSQPTPAKQRPAKERPVKPTSAAQPQRATRPKSGTVRKRSAPAPAPQRTRGGGKSRPSLPRPSEPVAKAGPLARATSAVSERAHRPSLGSSTPPTPWERVSATSSNVTTRMQERLREKRSAQTRLTALKWGKRLGLTAGVVGVGWLVLLSPIFALDPHATEASGFGSVVSPEEVSQVIAAHEGTSLVMLNTGQVSEEIEQLVGVRDVEITRVWPAGLRVEILSSEPVAAIPQGAEFLLVDDLGQTVNTADSPPEQLPIITIPVGDGGKRILAGVLDVVDEIPVALRDRVEGIEAQTEDSISFVLRDGPRVEWGSGEQSALKAEVLAALLDSQQAADVDVIDVSAPSLPITNRE